MSYIHEENDPRAPVTNPNDRLNAQFAPPTRTYGDGNGFGSGLLVAAVFIVVAIMASVILNITW